MCGLKDEFATSAGKIQYQPLDLSPSFSFATSAGKITCQFYFLPFFTAYRMAFKRLF
ncbi:hypothetical protein JXL19_08885 [bacterium]|nr:hypothetical protein [bacterium]